MIFSEKLQLLRKNKGYTQEEEEIYHKDEKAYECYFHGGLMR